MEMHLLVLTFLASADLIIKFTDRQSELKYLKNKF